MRNSSVEQIILEILSQEHAHLTSNQVYEEISARLPVVNPSTVYRALERMAKAGKVSISDMGTGCTVYELVGGELHHHLVCQNCGKVVTIGHEEVDNFFMDIENKHQFKIITNHLILFGVCQECQQSQNKE
jgi:Fur family transcriptional regulator, ferric uptake regulator